jgi:hypothetical protein
MLAAQRRDLLLERLRTDGRIVANPLGYPVHGNASIEKGGGVDRPTIMKPAAFFVPGWRTRLGITD